MTDSKQLPWDATLMALRDDCPNCGGKDCLDTGWECNICDFDCQPLIEFHNACEARGERMHPSGLYFSEMGAKQ